MKKWHKFKFVIHPLEFKDLFNGLDYYFPITNTRVPLNYKINDKISVILNYEAYYNKIISGEQWEKAEWKLVFHSAITDKVTNISYKEFEIEEKGKLVEYQLPEVKEPVINVSPFTLMEDSKDRLSVQFSDVTNAANIGLEFTYPTKYKDEMTGEYLPTDPLLNFQLYRQLTSAIKKLSKKAKVQYKGQISRPNFWISDRCIEEVNNNFLLKKKKITLI